MKAKLGLILFVIAFLLSSIVNATTGGSESGNGGDEVALQFESAFKKSLVEIKKKNDPFFAPVLKVSFSEKLPALKIMTVEEPLDVTAGGVTQESTALNFPANQLIKVNRSRWEAIETAAVREALALHEMLSLIGLEGTGNYNFSSHYLTSLNVPADLLNQASEVRIEKAEFRKNGDVYSIVAKARWQKGSGAFEEARIDYALWKNGKSIDSHGLKSMPSCTLYDNQLPINFVDVARVNSQEVGFVIRGMAGCGNHPMKRFQILVPSHSRDFEPIGFDSITDFQLRQKGDLLQIWYASTDVGAGPYCCGVNFPRLLEFDLKNGYSFEAARIPLNIDDIPVLDRELNFKNFPSLFLVGLATHDSEMMKLSVRYFQEDAESLRYYQQTGLPTTKSGALGLANAMRVIGGTLETFSTTRAIGIK